MAPRRVSCLVLWFGLVSVAAAQPVRWDLAAPVMGQVLDVAGQPVAGADIYAVVRRTTSVGGCPSWHIYRDDDGVLLELANLRRPTHTQADELGRYHLRELPAGYGDGVWIYVDAPGYEPQRFRSGGSYDVRLQPAAQWQLELIQAEAGAPVVQAEIRAQRPIAKPDANPMTVLDVVGEARAGRHTVLRAGSVATWLRIDAPGRATWEGTLPGLSPGDVASETVALEPEGVLAGQVRLPGERQPSSGELRVTVDAVGNDVPRPVERLPPVDAHGRWRLGQLATGRYEVAVSSANKAVGTWRAQLEVVAGERVEVQPVLHEWAQLVVVARSTSGDPLVRKPVSVRAPGEARGAWPRRFTDDHGVFSTRVNPGSWVIEVPGVEPVQAELAAGGYRRVDLVRHDAPRLAVRIDDVHGQPWTGVRWVARHERWGVGVSSSTGQGAVEGVEITLPYAGTWDVVAFDAGGEHSLGTVSVEAGERVARTFILDRPPRSRVVVRVSSPDDDGSLRAATLADVVQFRGSVSAPARRDWSFRGHEIVIDDVDPGDYELFVHSGPWAFAPLAVSVSEDGSDVELEWVGRRGVAIQGRLLPPEGLGLDGRFQVRARQGDVPVRMAWIGLGGQYELVGLTPGRTVQLELLRVRHRVSGEGWIPATEEVIQERVVHVAARRLDGIDFVLEW